MIFLMAIRSCGSAMCAVLKRAFALMPQIPHIDSMGKLSLKGTELSDDDPAFPSCI